MRRGIVGFWTENTRSASWVLSTKWIPDEAKLLFFLMWFLVQNMKKRRKIGYRDFNSSMPYYESKCCTLPRTIYKLTIFWYIRCPLAHYLCPGIKLARFVQLGTISITHVQVWQSMILSTHKICMGTMMLRQTLRKLETVHVDLNLQTAFQMVVLSLRGMNTAFMLTKTTKKENRLMNP